MCLLKQKFKRIMFIALSVLMFCSLPLSVRAAEDGDAETTPSTGTAGSQVYVESQPDAINEIMNNTRFNGAVEQIQWLTKWFDQFSVQVISVCAFLIIAAAFLKNAMAGAYCANSKFWDKVADAHAKKDALNLSMIKGYFSGGQYQNTTVAGFKDGILALIPNVKAFTDFDDADIQPKQYFMKSIPQMCMCVIIGVFIYNGYYRDTAAVVGEFGSEAFTRIMTAASPSEFLDKISQTTGMPTLLTDGLTDPQGKILNKIADAGRKACITEFSLNSNAQKIRVSAAVENWVLHDSGIQSWVSEHCQDEEDNAWKVSAKVKLVPATSGNTDGLSNESEDATTQVKVFMTEQPVVGMTADGGSWIMDSTESAKSDKQTLYLRVICTAVKTESSGGKNAGQTVDGSNPISTTKKGWGDDITIQVPVTVSNGQDHSIPNPSEGKLVLMKSYVEDNSHSVRVTSNNGSINLHINNLNNLQNGAEFMFATDLFYVKGNDDLNHYVIIKVVTN